MYQPADNADILVVITDWGEFKRIDLEKVKTLMKKPVIVDGRNLFNSFKMAKLGFDYFSIGRPR